MNTDSRNNFENSTNNNEQEQIQKLKQVIQK